MKKVIPVSKEIPFRTMIGEMVELNVEHSLQLIDDLTIEGNLIVTGAYKMTEASTITEEIHELIPVSIELDEKYDTSDLTIEISDFYYEIINDNILGIHAEISLDGLREKQEELSREMSLDMPKEKEDTRLSTDIDVIQSHLEKNRDTHSFVPIDDGGELPNLAEKQEVEKVPVVIPEEGVDLSVSPKQSVKSDIKTVEMSSTSSVGSLFSALENTEETFATYRIYIVRENDTLEDVLNRYETTKEEVESYNDLSKFQPGMKLIIPSKNTCHP